MATTTATSRSTRTLSPPVDIFETEKSYVLLADMPGVAPGGLEVVAERNELIVRGRAERPASTADYQEFELEDYYRAFTLSEDLDTERITATLRDGVLRIEIPKSPAVQPKKIPVRTEGATQSAQLRSGDKQSGDKQSSEQEKKR
jgi:HSP20 family molecular chaperone IbpA